MRHGIWSWRGKSNLIRNTQLFILHELLCRENTRGKWTPLYESQFDESVVGVIKLNGNDCTISFYIKEIFSVARGQNLKTVFHFVVNDFIFDNLTLFNLEIKSFHHKYFHHKFYEKLLLGKLSEVLEDCSNIMSLTNQVNFCLLTAQQQ